MQNWLGS